jgi:hypothetical protein
MTVVRQDDLLRKRYELLVSIPGIAQVSAMQLLAELSTLPQTLRCENGSHTEASIQLMKYQEAQ